MNEFAILLAYIGTLFVGIYVIWYDAKTIFVKLLWLFVLVLPFGWIIFLTVAEKETLTKFRKKGILLTYLSPLFLFPILLLLLLLNEGINVFLGILCIVMVFTPIVLLYFIKENCKLKSIVYIRDLVLLAFPIFIMTYGLVYYSYFSSDIIYSDNIWLFYASIPLVLSIFYFYKNNCLSRSNSTRIFSVLGGYLVLSFIVSNWNIIIIDEIKLNSKFVINDEFYSSLRGDSIPIFSGYIKADSICTLSFVDTIYLGEIHLEKSQSLADGTNVFIGSSDKEVHVMLGEKKKLYSIDESVFFTHCRWAKIDYDFDRCDNIECNAFADTDRIIIKPSFNIRINNMYVGNLPELKKRINNHNNFKETLKIAFIENNIFYIYYCDLYFKVEMIY